MYLTEDEAKKTKCDSGRIVGMLAMLGLAINKELGNREGFEAAESLQYCLASGCMKWRWHDWSKTDEGKNKLPLTGYCGLAGKLE